MASATPNTILLGINGEHRPIVEHPADTTGLLPGHLVTLNSDQEVIVHPDAGEDARPIFVLESPYAQDHTQPALDQSYPALDQSYPAGDLVRVVYAQTGHLIYAWLAAGEDVESGDALESAGDGTLQAHVPLEISGTGPHTVPSRAIVGYAAEAVNASVGTTPTDTRIRVRIA